MKEILEKYNLKIDNSLLQKELADITKASEVEVTKENLIACLGFIDLTSLHTSDTEEFIKNFTEKVNGFKAKYPKYPLPASICVYPNFAKTVKGALKAEGVGITTVSACFPSAQSFLDVKELEVKHALEGGATEIDIVLSQSNFLGGKPEKAQNEIVAIRKITLGKTLKVILESGALDNEQVAAASLLALEAGADFIKTSTGKQEPAATPMAALIMCQCLKAYNAVTGCVRGFKPAGGISKASDAILYYSIVKSVLGKEWLTPKTFRIGASSLANNLLSVIEGSTVKYF